VLAKDAGKTCLRVPLRQPLHCNASESSRAARISGARLCLKDQPQSFARFWSTDYCDLLCWQSAAAGASHTAALLWLRLRRAVSYALNIFAACDAGPLAPLR
jgi:hypothetical protein